MALSKLENQGPEFRRKLFGAKNGVPMIF